VRELGEERRGQVAELTEAARLVLHDGLTGVAIDQSERNKVENLLEDDYVATSWCFVVHTPYRVAGISAQHQSIFTASKALSCGTAVISILFTI
jgi:hypothetical protein